MQPEEPVAQFAVDITSHITQAFVKQGGKREQHACTGDGLRRLKLRLRLDELAGARQCAIQLALGRHARRANLIHQGSISRAGEHLVGNVALSPALARISNPRLTA